MFVSVRDSRNACNRSPANVERAIQRRCVLDEG